MRLFEIKKKTKKNPDKDDYKLDAVLIKKGDTYEYCVYLLEADDTDYLVDEWDSAEHRTSADDTLTKQEAIDAVNEIKDDVKNGKASNWFDIDDCYQVGVLW